MLEQPLTKQTLLNQADGLRDLARRARRLSETMKFESDQRRLLRHCEELQESAARLEQAAAEAKV
jgi:hypothetical protein